MHIPESRFIPDLVINHGLLIPKSQIKRRNYQLQCVLRPNVTGLPSDLELGLTLRFYPSMWQLPSHPRCFLAL